MPNAAVAVLDPGCVDPDAVPDLLPGIVVGQRHEGGWWDLVPVSDGALFLQRHQLGADVLTASFSSRELAEDPGSTLAWTATLLTTLAAQLPVRFGFVSRYGSWWEEPLLSEGVLIPLQEGRWDALLAAPHDQWFLHGTVTTACAAAHRGRPPPWPGTGSPSGGPHAALHHDPGHASLPACPTATVPWR
jgi:hypothetical protein